MKYMDKRWLLFLILIILLASGLSFLVLNQEAETEKETPNETHKMAIALVNEDEGDTFNGGELVFGDAFVKSVDSNNEHDWYVVSRGVAESGLERNTYDMMIIIPNDFSIKALSFETEAPEPVVLSYKINASENERVSVEAEKTASQILNDFNRRIIDVYFASIIGNLQDAQDNIGEIIEKQALHTNTYNSAIYNPLEGYTSQFGQIKDNTALSKDSFSGFEEMLRAYEEKLVSGAELEQDYVSNLDEVTQLKETNRQSLLYFYEIFNEYHNDLSHQDVDRQLEQLQAANTIINQQFQQRGNDAINTLMYNQPVGFGSTTIMNGSLALQDHLQSSLKKVEDTELKLYQLLDPENPNSFKNKVSNRLSELLANAFAEDNQLNINTLFENPDANVRENIRKQISKLPSLNEADFGGYGLPEETVTEIKNVIAVTNKYNSEIEFVAHRSDGDEILSDLNKIKELKDHIRTNGITITDTVELPENKKKSGQTFKLRIPEGYSVERLSLTLPNKEEKDYTKYLEDGKINLRANQKGNFTVDVTLLLDKDKEIDIYQTVSWGWELHQEDITNVDEPDEVAIQMAKAPLIASQRVEAQEDDLEQSNNQLSNELQDSTEKEENPSDSEESPDQSDETNNDNTDVRDEDNTSGSGNQPDKGDNDSDAAGDVQKNKEDEETPVIEKVKVINNTIRHEVMSPLTEMDITTKSLINTVINTISPYQKLLSSYESYFGLEMGSHDLRNDLNEKRLTEWGAESKLSLYHLFNEKDIADLLNDYIVNQVIDGVTEEIRQPLANLEAQIRLYRQEARQAANNAEQFVEQVVATGEQAIALNEALGETLAKVDAWRDESNAMLDEQMEIQVNDDGEQMAIMTLSDAFRPLLMTSESLAEQAQRNFDSAEHVYETFDHIDLQAETIEESGVALVNQAEVLSVDMTNKLLEDQQFAEKFAGVLANSRIGDRENENLYDFLSNPVQTSNAGTITANQTFTPYFLVLICFIVVLFTSYVISTITQKRVDTDQFATEKSLIAWNTPITLITAGIGVLEGTIIGVTSSYFLKISDGSMVLLTALIILLVTAMLLVATYLLRQLKMIGMFILLITLSLYLFLTNALGLGIAGLEGLRKASPLQYVESLLLRISQETANYPLAFLVITGVIVIGALANLLVLNHSKGERDLDNEVKAES
ncbi:type VII secretion protein EsaA [Virgibacillus sp. C22-A2]|uniref:Type VII secretion system accessory factor EsaA n=1 Tax=Virgibacillus tibetensis TaxID=3042313 RepID=A0ABU6KJ76_9BACI|nr:type VII secretion protein EsaA [Virgibacillus sp. C22-A2]